MSTKDVAEHGENVVHIHAGATAKSTTTAHAGRPIEPKLVVLLALFGVVGIAVLAWGPDTGPRKELSA